MPISCREVRDRVVSLLAILDYPVAELDVVGVMSGTANLCYHLILDGSAMILRVTTASSPDEHMRVTENARLAARVGVAPEIVAAHHAHGITLEHHAGGESLTRIKQPFTSGVIEAAAGTFARLRKTEGFSGIMDPWHKLHGYLAAAGVSDPQADHAFGSAWRLIRRYCDTCILNHGNLVASHIDPVQDNMFLTNECVILIDWEFSALTHPMWDLAYFCAESAMTEDDSIALVQLSGLEEDLHALRRWSLLSQAVSFAWCIMMHKQAPNGPVTDAELTRRRTRMEAVLAALQ